MVLAEVTGGGSSCGGCGGGTAALFPDSFWADIFLGARFHEQGVGAASDESEDEEREDFEFVLVAVRGFAAAATAGVSRGRGGRIWFREEGKLVVTVG